MDDAFLRAIRADPEADLPRLVYADWLDEHDDPARAEFVRVQCELAKLPDHDDAYAALEDREHELLAEHEAKWLGDGPTPDEWTFRRGFVDEVRLDLAATQPAGWLTRQAVTSVTLTRRDYPAAGRATFSEWDGTESVDFVSPFFNSSGLEGWSEIDATPLEGAGGFYHLRDFLARWDTPSAKSLLLAGVSGLAGLAASLRDTPVAHLLRRLRVGGASSFRYGRGEALNAPELAEVLRKAPLETLAAHDANLARLTPLLEARFAATLTSLDVSYNPLAADAYREFFAASPHLKLKHLDVSGTVLCGPTLRNLLASRCCETLTELAVNDGSPNPFDLGCLADSPFWSQAEELGFRRCDHVTSVTFEQLAKSAGPPALRSLDLGDNSLGPDGVGWLCAAQWARPITWLNLAGCALDSSAAWYLAQPDAFPHLRTLHLGTNNAYNSGVGRHEVNDDAIEFLVNSPTLARLRVLTLTANPVTNVGVDLLMNAPHFTLSGLGLSHTHITAAGVRTLAKSPRLARLNWLDLSDNAALHSDALLPLAESPYLSPLCDLDISRTGASDAVRDLLRQRLGRRAID